MFLSYNTPQGGDILESGQYKLSFKFEERKLASLTVYNTGMQRCEGGYTWGPGIRDHYLFHYVQNGRGTYHARGKIHSLSVGDLFLAAPGETILYTADPDDPWTYCWVGFHGLEAKALLSKTEFANDSPVKRCADDPIPYRLLLDIYNERGSEPHESLRMTGRLYLFFAWLSQQGIGKAKQKEQFGVEHARRACEFIANNFASSITVAEVASHVGVCRSRLYRAFRDHMETTPTLYLTQFRMQQACLLLEKTNLSVKAVAYSVGFEDPLYFSRRFKEIIGFTPSEYERRFCESRADK
jgi:AraC-like DNA-binding protein